MQSQHFQLNENALSHCDRQLPNVANITVRQSESGARIIDCGVHVTGGLAAGKLMAETCLAGLGDVEFVQANPNVWAGPAVKVTTDQPIAACMASQYAGWRVSAVDYFAMASGPMRAARGQEPLFRSIGLTEDADRTIGILESSSLPPASASERIAEDCRVAPAHLTLLVAPTSSIAGTIQVVARSVETALHKMHELGFDLSRVISGFGVAPLPPVADDPLTGMGRTNDAILYGGEVTLWIDEDDERLAAFGSQIPSSASSQHGEPFLAVFEDHDRDFYKIDPLLFSPACVTLHNVRTGRSMRVGRTEPEILSNSFMT